MRLTEQQIKFGEVVFPEHLVSPLCRSFIQLVGALHFAQGVSLACVRKQAAAYALAGTLHYTLMPLINASAPAGPHLQALTKRPESRPSAAQLFQHPWAQAHVRQLAVEQRQSAAAALVAAAGAAMGTPELRRTVSQPPSPSKSMPGALPPGMAQGGEAARTPAAVASALAPFLPPSQAKQAHKVRLAWARASGSFAFWLCLFASLVSLCGGPLSCSCLPAGAAAVPRPASQQRQGCGATAAAPVRPPEPHPCSSCASSSSGSSGRARSSGGRGSSTRGAACNTAPGCHACSRQRWHRCRGCSR